MEWPHRSHLAGALLAIAAAATAAGAAPPDGLALARRARAALAELRAFERLNAEIVKRCHEPVTGAYGDWREEFHVDLTRAHALDKALLRRWPDAADVPAEDERLKPFLAAEGQALYSLCLRWSTLLIQRESPVRTELAAHLGLLRDNEPRLRELLADDALWQEWRTSGVLR